MNATTPTMHACNPDHHCDECHRLATDAMHEKRRRLAAWENVAGVALVDAALASTACRCGCS